MCGNAHAICQLVQLARREMMRKGAISSNTAPLYVRQRPNCGPYGAQENACHMAFGESEKLAKDGPTIDMENKRKGKHCAPPYFR
jgi:hypothetical protein